MFLCKPYNNGKPNMGYIKFKKIIGLALVFALGFSPVAMGFAAGSGCGNMCAMNSVMRGTESGVKTNTNSISKGCCSENSMMPCDFESGQTADLPEYITTSSRIDDQDASGFMRVASHDVLGNQIPKSFRPNSHTRTLALFTPLYLENLSLLI